MDQSLPLQMHKSGQPWCSFEPRTARGWLERSLGTTSRACHPTPTLTTSRRWLQNSFSLPELQCFISDSQLTRDAALHLRLGDRRAWALGAWALGLRLASCLGRRRSVSTGSGLLPSRPVLPLPWIPLRPKSPSSFPFSLQVSFLEVEPIHLKCAVNFFSLCRAGNGTQGLALIR